MLQRTFVLLLGLSLNHLAWSFDCYFTVAKDSCWTNYNVSVSVIETKSNTVLTTVSIPAGKSWYRQKFSCQPGQKLLYNATFSPVFWASDLGKTYPAQNYLSLPESVNSGDTAWNLSVCYPTQFSEVPLPPDAKGNCACDFKSIPDPAPQ